MNNSLLEVKKGFFTKILNFLKKIFGRKTSKNNIKQESFETKNKETKVKYSKEKFFDFYNKIKTGKISALEIDITTLEKIYHVLEEECRLRERNLEKSKKELEILLKS